MKNCNKIIILVACVLLSFAGRAQQDPQFTQYMYNMSVINPAYATDDIETINLGGIYRSQWVGLEGAPTTASFFAHTPMGKKVEMGFSIVNDDIGNIVSETNAYIDFAYVLSLGETSKLSLGLKAGATFFNTDFGGLVFTDDTPDASFAENISRTLPNVGAGLFFFDKHYYVGLSTPNFLKGDHIESEDGRYYKAVEDLHYFFTGGYVFDLNENVKFKPAFMTKMVYDTPLSLDLTANFLFNARVEIGAGYRVGDSFSGLFNFRLSPSLRVGYAYDRTFSNLGKFNSGSHEILVLFDINKNLGKSKGYDVSPRFY